MISRDARSNIEKMEARLWNCVKTKPTREIEIMHTETFMLAKAAQTRGKKADISGLKNIMRDLEGDKNREEQRLVGKYPVLLLLPEGIVTIYMNKAQMMLYESYIAAIREVLPAFDEIDDCGWQHWTTIREGAAQL